MNPSNLLLLALSLSSIFGHSGTKQEFAIQAGETPVPVAAQAPNQDTAPATTSDTAPPATVPAPGPAATPSASSPADSYIIGPSDVLTITVWKEPTLSGTILVRPDGMISLALLGDVQASGMTPLQLADQITAKLKKYIQDPNVSVVISQIHSKVVYLLGEVVKRGPVEMTPGMTILQAIASAGGLTDFASQRKIYLLRNEAGSQQRIPIKYKDALKGKSSFDLAVKPGDTIVVP
jgi:polysaccharide export outer membrane protein